MNGATKPVGKGGYCADKSPISSSWKNKAPCPYGKRALFYPLYLQNVSRLILRTF
jgi:hypothetical protein